MLQEMEWRSARGARFARQAGIPLLITAPNKTNKIFHEDQYHLLAQLQISTYNTQVLILHLLKTCLSLSVMVSGRTHLES